MRRFGFRFWAMLLCAALFFAVAFLDRDEPLQAVLAALPGLFFLGAAIASTSTNPQVQRWMNWSSDRR